MNILETKNLSLELGGKQILNDLNIEIWEGHVHAIVGINGAGKSTLANTIVGLSGYQDFTGDILFKGNSLKGKSIDERAAMGITLAWQEPARFEGLKVKDFILAGAKNKDLEIAKQALATVGLRPADYLGRAVDKTLSGGERKKIELASILVMNPSLALLDEPDSGIDIESIEKIFQVVKRLKDGGTTVVFITHSQAVLSEAEHAFLFCHGQLVDKGSVAKINKYFEDECMPCDLKDPDMKEGV